MKKLPGLAKNPWLLAGMGGLLAYALLGFFLIPFLIQHYTPPLVAENIKRQASVGKVYFNPFLFSLEIDDFSLEENDGRPVFALRHLLVDFDLESIFRRAWVFGDLILEDPKLDVVMDQEGKLNLASIAESIPKSEGPPPPSSPPPRILLKHLALRDGVVTYTRQSATETLSPLNLELDDISTLPDSQGINALDAKLGDDGLIHWDGHFSLEPIQAEGDFRLEGVDLNSAWKLVHDRLNLSEAGGQLAFSSHYRFGLQQEKVELNLSKLNSHIAKLHLALTDATEPMLDMDAIRLENAEIDLTSRNAKLPLIAVENGQVKVAVDGKGLMNWQNLVKQEPQSSVPAAAASPPPAPMPTLTSTTPSPAATPAAKTEASWRVELGVFKLANIGIAYADASSLTPYAANIGKLGLDLAATAEVGEGEPKVGVNNIKLAIRDIQIAQTGPSAAADPLLKLANIQLDGAELDLGQRSVKLPSFIIEKGQVEAAVNKAGILNWQNLSKPEPKNAPSAPAQPTPADPAGKAEAPWRVELGYFKLADLGIAYADDSSRAPYAASIGNFELNLSAKAEVGGGEPEVGLHDIKLGIKDILIAETGPSAATEPLLKLGNIQLDGAEFDLAQRNVKLRYWFIEKGLAQVAVDAQGELNWLRLTKSEIPKTSPKPPDYPVGSKPGASKKPAMADKASVAKAQNAPQAPWRLELGNFKLAEMGIRYADASHKRPYSASVGSIGLDIAATLAEVGAGDPKAQVNGLNLAIKDIKLSENEKSAPLLAWDSLQVGGGRLDLAKRELVIDKIALKGGGAKILREPDDTINLTELFAPKAGFNALPEPPMPPAAKGKTPAPLPWHVALKSFALQGFRLAYSDYAFSPTLAYDANSIDINLANINYPSKNPLNFDAKLKLKQGGTLTAAGKALATGDSADVKVRADRLNLTPLQPVVGKFAKLKLDSANFSSNLQVGFRQSETGPAIKAAGTVGLDSLLLNEVAGGQRLLSWKTLSITGIDFGLKPDHLNIKEVSILEPGAKVAIAKDKSNNFSSAFKSQPASAPVPTKPQQISAAENKAKPESAAASSKPFPLKVERVRLENGIIDFSDMSLVIPFTTRIHDFDGTATDISTAPHTRTNLKFTGRVEEFGEVKVGGSLIPSSFKTFSDINVIFRNVEMSSLSPYSATFAGRKITSGKLSLDLVYKIENSKLKSENKILLDQFSLGEQVESPGATSLPLDLAIALLKDGEGKINATVPIEGDVDNPQFAYGGLIWDAFVTLVKTAVTAPFRALGSVLGVGGEEDLGTVLFSPGSAAIAPPEREKVQKVTRALAQRPKVKLTVRGGFDTKLDGEALRSVRVRQAVARQLGEESRNEDEPNPLSFSDAKTQKALETLATERGGASFFDAEQAEFEKSAGHKPSRISGASALLGRASEDAIFYEMAYKHLVEAEPLPTNELESLADRRGKVVLKELAVLPGFDAGRVAAGKVESVSGGQDGKVATKLELGAKE